MRLYYSCEIWGLSKSKEIERIHLKFCKQLLNVKKSTSNMAVYGELGRYPLFINRYTRMIKYWCKILRSENIIISTLYKELVDMIGDKTGRNWALDIKSLLDNYGFSYVWINPKANNLNTFPALFKHKVHDVFLQTWNTTVNSSSPLHLYKNFKFTCTYETYLNVLPAKYRIALSRLRLSSHKLRIETGRYSQNRTERRNRLCTFCDKGEIEDEYHFILICEAYQQLRRLYIKPYYYRKPNVYKFMELMKSESSVNLKKLSKFTYEAFALRITLLQ